MRILFSNPPWWGVGVGGIRAGSRWPFTLGLRSAPDRFVFGDYLPYPFFMGYAMTYAARAFPEATVVFRDSIALRESYGSFGKFLDENPFDFVVIESASPSWEHDAALIANNIDGAKVIVTGPIAVKGKALLTDRIVAVVKGEYEKGVVRVLNGERGVIEHDLLTEDEMNAAPFPYFDATYAHRYWDSNPRGQMPPQAQVWSSRGCPYKCCFCVWPATMTGNDPDGNSKRTVRHYTSDYMQAFLSEILGKYRHRTVYFDDDTFNLGNKHVASMCGVMRRVGVPWSAMCRADTIKLDLWREMRDSGCFGVKIGFESGNQTVNDTIVNKRLNLENARNVVKHIQSLGMTVHGTFTYGLPGETREQMQDTKNYIQTLGLDTLQESGCAEIEGTPLANLTADGLKAYPGAKRDDGYMQEADGRVKYERLGL